MCCFSQPTASVCSKGEQSSQFRTIMSPNIKLGIEYRQLFFLTSNGVDERNWSYPATPIRFFLLDDLPTRWEAAVVNFIPSGAAAAHARCHQSPTGRFPGLKQATAPVGESPGPNRNVAMSFYLFFVKEGTIETSLFSWLRFPTSLRLCHSHVFGGFNHGDVCYKGRKNTQFEDFFFFVEAIGCRRICFLVSTSG